MREPLHLASSSPRRREILSALGLEFTCAGADVDEQRRDNEPAADMVRRLAIAKAQAALPRDGVVLAADTTVALSERVFGKPTSETDALDMLMALSGQTHHVVTGIAVAAADSLEAVVAQSEVVFRDIDPAEAAVYWQSGEPRDKAGGYAIQGLGGLFVRELRGSYTGVVGLPVFETAQLLRHAGIDVMRGGKR